VPDPLPFSLVVVLHGGLRRDITSISAAAEMLLREWPEEGKGPAYAAATRACLNALEGKTTAEVARRAFMIAAQEAGIFVRAG
jgi:Protein of unknown function (DUF982)